MGTTAQKLEYLETTKSQLKTMISYGYPLSNETFREYVGAVFKACINSMSDTLNTTWNNLPKIKGGINLYNIYNTQSIGSGVTIDENGWITATADNTDGTSTKIYDCKVKPNLYLKTNTDYSLIVEVKNVSGTGAITVNQGNSTNTQFNQQWNYTFNQLQNNTVYVKNNMTTISSFNNITVFFQQYLYWTAGQSGSITFRISVIEDTSVTPETFVYQPYTGGLNPNQSINNTIKAPMRIELEPSQTIQNNLPSGYTEVEYIESTGTQYIITNITPTNTTGIKAKISPTDVTGDKVYFGSRSQQDGRYWVGSNGNVYFGFNLLNYSAYTPTQNEILDIEFNYNNNRLCKVNTWTSSSLIDPLISNTAKLAIFTGNNMGNYTGLTSHIKLYDLIVTNNSTITNHFIPCYRNKDNAIGLYDVIKQQFHTNSGTGTFVKGNDKKPSPDNVIEIHENSGDNKLDISGKNLFKPSNGMSRQMTFSTDENGLHINGTCQILTTAGSLLNCSLPSQEMPKLLAGTYTLSGFVSQQTNNDAFFIIYDKNDNVVIDRTYSTKTFTLTTDLEDGWYFKFFAIQGNSYNLTIPLQLELGSNATTYEPYKGKEYEIYLGVDNLLNLKGKVLSSSNGISYIYNEDDGSISFSGTASATYSNICNNINIPLKAGAYKFSITDFINVQPTIRISDDNGVLNTTSIATTTEANVNLSSDATKYYLYLGGLTNGTSYSGKIYLQLEKGNVKHPFTQYGKAIHYSKLDETYKDIIKRSDGRNLMPKPTLLNNNTRKSITYNGITYTCLGGGHFHIKGTASAQSSCNTYDAVGGSDEVLIVPAGTYTFSTPSLPSGVKIIISGGNRNGFSYYELSSLAKTTTSTVTDGTKSFNYVVIRVESGTTVDTDVYFMLESGSTASDWQPYGNGIWYIKHNVGKVVLNGTEDGWGKTTTSAGYRYYITINDLEYATSSSTPPQMISNYFISLSANDTWTTTNSGISTNTSGNRYLLFVLVSDDTDTVDKFKTWLSTHNTEVYYILSTPTYELLNDTLQKQLEAIYNSMSQDGQTNILQINNDLPFILNSVLLQDLSSL